MVYATHRFIVQCSPRHHDGIANVANVAKSLCALPDIIYRHYSPHCCHPIPLFSPVQSLSSPYSRYFVPSAKCMRVHALSNALTACSVDFMTRRPSPPPLHKALALRCDAMRCDVLVLLCSCAVVRRPVTVDCGNRLSLGACTPALCVWNSIAWPSRAREMCVLQPGLASIRIISSHLDITIRPQRLFLMFLPSMPSTPFTLFATALINQSPSRPPKRPRT